MPDRHGVVGGGIVGLALARALSARGHRVTVFDADREPQGASIRNFGTLWPIGQPPGPRLALAMRSMEIWRDVLNDTGAWSSATGSLHLAYHADEATVLQQFAAIANATGFRCEWADADSVRRLSAIVRSEGLVGGLASPHEIQINPRQLMRLLAAWLAEQRGVTFERGVRVVDCGDGRIRAGARRWRFDHVWIASGADVETLYPEAFAAEGLRRCKLQMLRTAPVDLAIGPVHAGGLTLAHYESFAGCAALPALKARLAEDWPAQVAFGVHVLLSRHDRGELVIGDSHEYDDAIAPFDRMEIDALILDYLRTFVECGDLTIAERWHGIYLKSPKAPYCVLSPEQHVTIVAALGGHGMTMSFGLAEQLVRS